MTLSLKTQVRFGCDNKGVKLPSVIPNLLTDAVGDNPGVHDLLVPQVPPQPHQVGGPHGWMGEHGVQRQPALLLLLQDSKAIASHPRHAEPNHLQVAHHVPVPDHHDSYPQLDVWLGEEVGADLLQQVVQPNEARALQRSGEQQQEVEGGRGQQQVRAWHGEGPGQPGEEEGHPQHHHLSKVGLYDI